MRLSPFFQKLIYFEELRPKKFNLLQFIFEAILFSALVLKLFNGFSPSCTIAENGFSYTLYFILGIVLSIHLAYYQASNITWDRGIHIRPLAGPWQIFVYSISFLLPGAFFGC
ncbi:MAG TPA: hypothetical protein EYG71_08070 [Leucothrix sp.]|nr:hypothetical protein [Leucothrix sp.]